MFSKLQPKLKINTIYDIDLMQLWNHGFRGIITDLDNTLVGASDKLATPELVQWLEKVKSIGFKVAIVSNNERLRVETFAAPLQIPYFYRAKKPINASFRKALAQLELTPQQTVVIGDQMLTDVLGGNRMGLYTIMVQPISTKDEGFFTRINRKIEKLALVLMKK